MRLSSGPQGSFIIRTGISTMSATDISHTSGQLRIGQPVQRLEDRALLTGAAHFIDDLVLPGAVHAVFLRSPHVHARVVSIDPAAARKAPGVLGVFTAADLTKAGIGPMCITVVQKNRDGSAAPTPSRPVLASDEVRFVGEAVAMVVATSVREAK